MKRKGIRSTKLRRKGTAVKRETMGLFYEGTSFLPGVGLARTTLKTTRRAARTAGAANDYLNELYKVAKRKVRKYNVFH